MRRDLSSWQEGYLLTSPCETVFIDSFNLRWELFLIHCARIELLLVFSQLVSDFSDIVFAHALHDGHFDRPKQFGIADADGYLALSGARATFSSLSPIFSRVTSKSY
jgi:hypothetical protein